MAKYLKTSLPFCCVFINLAKTHPVHLVNCCTLVISSTSWIYSALFCSSHLLPLALKEAPNAQFMLSVLLVLLQYNSHEPTPGRSKVRCSTSSVEWTLPSAGAHITSPKTTRQIRCTRACVLSLSHTHTFSAILNTRAHCETF